MEQWIEEFLYRGRPPSGSDSDKAPTFHVVIGQQVDSPFDGETKQRRTVGPMSLESAEQAGWTFAEIVADMNADAIKQCAAHEVTIAELNGELETTKKAVTAAETAVATLQNENDEWRQLYADLIARMEAEATARAEAEAQAAEVTE